MGKWTKGCQRQTLDDIGIDALCEMMAEGKSQRMIAAEVGVSPWRLCCWLAAEPQRSAKARTARAVGAALWDDKAEEALKAIPDGNDTNGAVARQRELASHYRWRAKAQNPQQYGDRQVLMGDPEAPIKTETKLTADAADLVALIRGK